MIRRFLGLLLLTACAAQKPATGPASAPDQASPAGENDPEAFRKARPKPGAPGTFVYPTPTAIELPNGLRVLYVRRPGRVLSLAAVVRHGASSVPEGKSGLAALLARMLTESTRKRSAMALAEAVESLGTTLGAAASRDDSRVSLTVLPADFEPALRLLGEVVMEPGLLPRDFERVKAEWLDGVRAERQDPSRLAALAAMRLLNGPVLGAPVNGSLPHVKRLGIADLRDFHARAYTPDNTALIVVGEIDEAAVRAEVTRVFGGWQGKSAVLAPARAASAPPAKARIFVIDRPGAVQTAISAVQPFPKRADPGHEAREILVTTLGGLFTSRLNTNLREEHGFTYGAFARAQEARYSGTLLIGTSVRTEVTAESLVEIHAELEALRSKEPPTAEELARSRADLEFSLGATLEHPSKIAGVVSSIVTEELPLDYYARYATEVARVTPTQILQASQLLSPSNLVITLVGDRKQLEPELTKAGFQVEAAPPEVYE